MKTLEEIIPMLDTLSEVELFFVFQEIRKRMIYEKLEGNDLIVEHIIKLTKKFGVKMQTSKRKGTFVKWLTFWKNWQSEMTIGDLREMIDKITFSQSYQEYLPKTKWNEKIKIVEEPRIGRQG
jgi:hypothetical protein